MPQNTLIFLVQVPSSGFTIWVECFTVMDKPPVLRTRIWFSAIQINGCVWKNILFDYGYQGSSRTGIKAHKEAVVALSLYSGNHFLPWWYLPNFDSSISIIFPGPPVCCGPSIAILQQMSLQVIPIHKGVTTPNLEFPSSGFLWQLICPYKARQSYLCQGQVTSLNQV